MQVIFVFIFLLFSIRGYDFVDHSEKQIAELKKQKSPLESSNMQQNINYLWLKTNKFYKNQAKVEGYYVLLTKIDPSQSLNLNLYSPDAPFGYVFQIKELSFSHQTSEKQKKTNEVKQSEKIAQDFINQIKANQKLLEKISSKLQYKHFLQIESSNLMKVIEDEKVQKLLMIAIFFPQRNHSETLKQKNKKYNFMALISTNQIFIDSQSFQNPFQYKLDKNQAYSVKIPAIIFKKQQDPSLQENHLKTDLYYDDNKKTLIFHIIHLVGDYQYNISLIKQSNDGNDQPTRVLIGLNITESSFIINRSLIFEKGDFSIKNDQELLNQTQINFQIRCISKGCNFISEIQKESKIKKVVPGLPYIYSIKEIQIFQFTNPFDLEILIDISKKNGLPQYEICSTKNPELQQNQCIQQLRKPTSSFHVLEVKEKDDKVHALSRNHEIFINPQHQEYCFTCTYYIALYAEYDNVLGMITFQNLLSKAIIPEGSSVTKVLKRNQTYQYEIFGLKSGILFENFSGQYQIYFQVVDLLSEHDMSIQMKNKKNRLTNDLQSLTQDKNYYTLDLNQLITIELQKTNQLEIFLQKSNNTIYRLLIQTKNNFPSTFYSMVVVNDQTRKIILKDGVPFFNKQKNQLSVFKYLTENLQTENFGTIIINSNQIQQIGLEIFGNCLTFQDIQANQKKLKIEKEETSTLQTLKNRAKMSSLAGKKIYQMQKIENTKINLMANRIDIIIEPKMCKSYTIKISNNASKQSSITYEILVSFIDSIILPLNNEIPGILQYPGKIIQIYEIYVPQKTNISIMINFCRSAKSRMKIYKDKEALLIQNADEKVFFNSQSEFQESIYLARAGVFYVTIQFFGFSNILEYTILVKQHEIEEGFYYVDLSKQEQQIRYEVKDGRFFSTTYQLYFSPIFLKHWSKDIQRDVEYFETNYFILESNSYPLLKRASNCKGQFFSDIVNHHEHFRQVKLQKEKLKFHPQEKPTGKQKGHLAYYERGYYSYEYETNNPLSFLIIVPVIGKSTAYDQISIIRYWQFDKKSRQPYQITQLYNGKLYSVFQHWFLSFIIWAEEIVDFHPYENFLVMMILVCSCLPLSCCFLICVYRTKVSIEFYCNKLRTCLERLLNRQKEGEVRNHEIEVYHQQRRNEIDQNIGFSVQTEERQDIEPSQIQNENSIFGMVNATEDENNLLSEENPQQQLEESPLA